MILKNNKIQSIELRTAKIFVREDEIICVEIKDDVDIELADAIEHFETVKKISDGRKRLVLVYSGKGATITKEVRDFSSTPEAAEPTLAQAIVVNNLASRIVANFYIQFNKPYQPVKLFTDESVAIEWLKKMEREYSYRNS
jgi:hypothetical protein